jgi:hypothetical protein
MALSSELRSALEKAVVAARDAAEDASRAALGVLAVDIDRVPEHLDEESRSLRVALRAEARQLGGFERLIEECAYEQWHRMLFARFLAENELLGHPEHGVAVSLADCEEIAHARGGADLWIVACEFASKMLPGIFRSDDPALQLTLTPEGQQRLEAILAGLPPEVFTSEDGLGWVYQYWQAKKKKEVNASERKIGGADIAPVTQLFTENYMVRFLLENTLGAWWATHHSGSPLLKEWEYLRFDDERKPAAGGFPGWPETVAEVTVMDPCCGSAHFLIVAFEMLRQMRMEAESLSEAEAGDAVLSDNLFGLELDPRCTQIATFALALQAWKTGGYRELPTPNIACSGISAGGRLEDWKKLAGGDERLERSLERLHALFSDASDLGSLIDPLRESDGDLLVAEFEEVAPLLDEALKREATSDPSATVFGHAASGATRAAALLGGRYTLVVTNPPFLGRGKQCDRLKSYCDRVYSLAKADLSTCFIERNISLTATGGTVAMVTPQTWLFLTTYTKMRQALLTKRTWQFVARLGPGAFEAVSGHVVNVALVALTETNPPLSALMAAFDASALKKPAAKAAALRAPTTAGIRVVAQAEQLRNPDARVTLDERSTLPTLGSYCICRLGLGTGDSPHYIRKFWELRPENPLWRRLQMAPAGHGVGGREHVVIWDHRNNKVLGMSGDERRQAHSQDYRGREAWGRDGVAVSIVGDLRASGYQGELFDKSMAAIIPESPTDLTAVAAFATSSNFVEEVRTLDQKVMVTNATLVKVPFDLEHWRRVGEELYPRGLPEPESDDATQWPFHGCPSQCNAPLQVTVARLAGYQWPAELDRGMRLSDRARALIRRAQSLRDLADDDGIVCLPAIRGEQPAAERLRAMLAAAYGEGWSPAKEADLLAEAGYAGKSLEHWLRDGWFEQHCEVFHQRPFVWHIWDGRRDGFSALVNYQRLDRASLEKLTYTYLGEWIRRQREGATASAPGSDVRLAAAKELRKKLELILEGEPPYDIFVRWKPLEEQPIGWEPDLNDGVRLNIRPFVTAGVLRKDPKISWGKDRGKDPESAPWYPTFSGDRINDHHLALAEKRAAREAADQRAAVS